jgi:hypothetical protein
MNFKAQLCWRGTGLFLTCAAAALLISCSSRVTSSCTPEQSFTGLPAITDLGPGQTYIGEAGGLYPNSSNDMPAGHRAAGEAIARRMVPLNTDGAYDPTNGRVVAVNIGISLTLMVWNGVGPGDPNYTDQYLVKWVNSDPTKNPKLQLGQIFITGERRWDTRDPGNPYYGTANQMLADQGITPAQVQIAWFYPFPLTQQQNGGDDSFPALPRWEKGAWKESLRALKQVYPNLKMVYLGTKHHTYVPPNTPGAAQDPQQHGLAWSVKWVIEDQINGDPGLNYDPSKGPVVAPWIAWGPYFWSDGPTPRAYDGFHFDCHDVYNFLAGNDDFTHPGKFGIEKEAGLLFDFFRNDSTATPWYYGSGSASSL